jgi:ankyrin repeat protein
VSHHYTKILCVTCHVHGTHPPLPQVKVLLDHDADIETTCSGRQGTPIMHAAHNGHAGIIKLLVQYGAKLEARDMSHLSACMIAVSCDRTAAVDVLLRAGAQVDAKSQERGKTALHLAVLYASIDSIHLLVAANADVNMKDTDGMTPLDYANEGGRSYIIQALDQAGTKVRAHKKIRVARQIRVAWGQQF